MAEVYGGNGLSIVFEIAPGATITYGEPMGMRRMISDVAVAAAAGYIALGVMDLVTSRVYALSSEADKEREKEVSPGVAYTVAAKKTAGLLGVPLSEQQAIGLGSLYHYLMGVSWASVYVMLRRVLGASAIAGGLLTGLGLWAGFDEGAVPALGFSAPSSAYPRSTHLRGLLGHLAYGLSVMAVVEAVRSVDRDWPSGSYASA